MITTENQHFTHFYKQFTNNLLIFTNIFCEFTRFYKHFFASFKKTINTVTHTKIESIQ